MKFDSIRRANAAKVFSFGGDFFLNPWNNFCIFLLSIRILCPELFFSIFFFKILETFFIFISIRILRSEIFLGFFFSNFLKYFFRFFFQNAWNAVFILFLQSGFYTQKYFTFCFQIAEIIFVFPPQSGFYV